LFWSLRGKVVGLVQEVVLARREPGDFSLKTAMLKKKVRESIPPTIRSMRLAGAPAMAVRKLIAISNENVTTPDRELQNCLMLGFLLSVSPSFPNPMREPMKSTKMV
jgi:hypothetical protein